MTDNGVHDIDERVPDGTMTTHARNFRVGTGEVQDGHGKMISLVIFKINDENMVYTLTPEGARGVAESLLSQASLLDNKKTTIMTEDK